jgi:uncharacterized protein
MSDLVTNVSDLLHHPGARRSISMLEPITGMEHTSARVVEPLRIDVILERIPDGVVVRGQVSGSWSAECSRCLNPVDQPFVVSVAELFEDSPVDGETYPIVDETIDLEAPIRDVIGVSLPNVPLCSPDCQGLCPSCGIDRNVATCSCATSSVDPRWDALKALNLDIPTE